MDITLDKKNETEATLHIQAVATTYLPIFKKKLKDEAQKLQIKGFRQNSPQKVAMIKQRYGKEILKDTVLARVQQEAQQYLDKHKIITLGSIVPSKEVLEKIDWKEGDAFKLSFQIDMAAPFQCVLDKEIKVEAPKVTGIEKVVLEKHVKGMQEAFGDKKEVEAVQCGDVVAGRVVYGEGDEEVISFKLTTAGIEKVEMVDKKVGETVLLPATFLKEAVAVLSKKLEENSKRLTEGVPFAIEKITRVVPALLDQKFFDLVVGSGVAQNLKDFHQKMEEVLLMRYQNQAEQILHKNIRKALVERAQIVLPAKYKSRGEQMAWEVVARYLCRENNIKITPEEIVDSLSKTYQRVFAHVPEEEREKMVRMRIQQDLQDPAQRGLNRVGGELLADRLHAFIKDKITVVAKDADVATLQKQLLNRK